MELKKRSPEELEFLKDNPNTPRSGFQLIENFFKEQNRLPKNLRNEEEIKRCVIAIRETWEECPPIGSGQEHSFEKAQRIYLNMFDEYIIPDPDDQALLELESFDIDKILQRKAMQDAEEVEFVEEVTTVSLVTPPSKLDTIIDRLAANLKKVVRNVSICLRKTRMELGV